MRTNRKADLPGIGFNLKTSDYFADNQKAFSTENHTTFQPLYQCQKCSLIERRLRQMESLCRRLAEHIDLLEVRV